MKDLPQLEILKLILSTNEIGGKPDNMKTIGEALETQLINLKILQLTLDHNYLAAFEQNMEFLCKGLEK